MDARLASLVAQGVSIQDVEHTLEACEGDIDLAVECLSEEPAQAAAPAAVPAAAAAPAAAPGAPAAGGQPQMTPQQMAQMMQVTGSGVVAVVLLVFHSAFLSRVAKEVFVTARQSSELEL